MRKIVVGAVLVLALGACGGATKVTLSGSRPLLVPTTTAPSGHMINGTLELNDDVDTWAATGGPCSGTDDTNGGFDDIVPGAQVTVTNQAQTIVATGTLGAGTVETLYSTCEFVFTVPDVPTEQFYTVTVSHRGGVTYSEAQMTAQAWDVGMTLGSVSSG